MKNLLIVLLALSPVLGFAKENRSGPRDPSSIACSHNIDAKGALAEAKSHQNKQVQPQGKATAGGIQ